MDTRSKYSKPPFQAQPARYGVPKINFPDKHTDVAITMRLFNFIDTGDITLIKKYIQDNNISLRNIYEEETGENPLYHIIRSKNILDDDKYNLIKYFLIRGVSANMFDKYNITPLHLAVKYQLEDVVDLLLEYNADPNALDSNNMNTLHYAVSGYTFECPPEKSFSVSKIADNSLSTTSASKTKYKSEDTVLAANISDDITKLLNSSDEFNMYFMNLYKNIKNHDLYENEIADIRSTFDTERNKITEDSSNLEFKKKKINELIVLFSNKLYEKLINKYNLQTEIKLIDITAISDQSELVNIGANGISDLIEYFDNLKKKCNKNLQDVINEEIDNLNNIKILKEDINYNIIDIKNYLGEILWLNRTLGINYDWDGSGNPIISEKIDEDFTVFVNYESPRKIKNLHEPDEEQIEISLNDDNLDNLFCLDSDDFDDNFNLLFEDKNILRPDINNEKYKDINISDNDINEYQNNNYLRGEIDQDITQEDNILGYDIDLATATTNDKLKEYTDEKKKLYIESKNKNKEDIEKYKMYQHDYDNALKNFEAGVPTLNKSPVLDINDFEANEKEFDKRVKNAAKLILLYGIDQDYLNNYAKILKPISDNKPSQIPTKFNIDQIDFNIDHPYTQKFDFSFKKSASDPEPYKLSERAKNTFLKKLYVMNDLLYSYIDDICNNYENSNMHDLVINHDTYDVIKLSVPAIYITYANCFWLLKNINDEITNIENKIINIFNIFEKKKNEILNFLKNKNIPNEDTEKYFNHMWIFNYINTIVDNIYNILQSLKERYRDQIFNILCNNKYNNLLKSIETIQGIFEIQNFNNNYIIDPVKNIYNFDILEGMFDNMFDENYIRIGIFDDKFNELKMVNLIKFDNIKNLSRESFLNIIGFRKSKTLVYYNIDDADENTFENYLNILNKFTNDIHLYLLNFPLKTQKDATYMLPSSMIIQMYLNHVLKLPESTNYNESLFPNDIDPNNKIYVKKKDGNLNIIDSVIDNHFYIIKYNLIYYFVNCLSGFYNYNSVFKDIENINNYLIICNNFKKYIELFKKKIKSYAMKNAHSMIIKMINDIINNFVKFYLNQEAKQIMYKIADSNYKIPEDPYKDSNRIPIINTTDFKTRSANLDFINTNKKEQSREEFLGLQIKDTGAAAYTIPDLWENGENEENIEPTYSRSVDNICYKINPRIIRKLIIKNANPSQKDNQGKMPISYALELKDLNLITALSKTGDIAYYKHTSEVIDYYNRLFKETIEETISNQTYAKFYKKYTSRIAKKLEERVIINTRILSSIDLTIPMYMALFNSMLINIAFNFNYGWTQENTNQLQQFLNLNTIKISGQTYYDMPILNDILKDARIYDPSKIKIRSKLENYKKEFEKRLLFEENRKNQISTQAAIINSNVNIYRTGLNTVTAMADGIETRQKIPHITSNKIIQTNLSISSMMLPSKLYNMIFINVLNNNSYTKDLDIKSYRSLWMKYLKDLQDSQDLNYFTNIHLNTINKFLEKQSEKKLEKDDIELLVNLYGLFDKASRDYFEGPQEYNNTNIYLKESIDLITHTVTHTVFNYFYFYIVKMIIKYLKESYPDQDSLHVEYLEKFLEGDNSTESKLLKYLFSEMPLKFVKITLKKFDMNDPDELKTIDDLFEKLIQIIEKHSTYIIDTRIPDSDKKSRSIKDAKKKINILDIKTYVIPYFREYMTVIVTQLYEFNNNTFRYMAGISKMLEIYKDLNY